MIRLTVFTGVKFQSESPKKALLQGGQQHGSSWEKITPLLLLLLCVLRFGKVLCHFCACSNRKSSFRTVIARNERTSRPNSKHRFTFKALTVTGIAYKEQQYKAEKKKKPEEKLFLLLPMQMRENDTMLNHNIIWLSVKSAKRMLRPSDLSSETEYCSSQHVRDDHWLHWQGGEELNIQFKCQNLTKSEDAACSQWWAASTSLILILCHHLYFTILKGEISYILPLLHLSNNHGY